MDSSTSEQRHAFVDTCRSTESVAYLDGTRDGYRTVIVATLSANAAEDIQEAAHDAGYTVATTWRTTLFCFLVFSTTPGEMPEILSASDPPSYLVSNALEYFTDPSHAR